MFEFVKNRSRMFTYIIEILYFCTYERVFDGRNRKFYGWRPALPRRQRHIVMVRCCYLSFGHHGGECGGLFPNGFLVDMAAFRLSPSIIAYVADDGFLWRLYHLLHLCQWEFSADARRSVATAVALCSSQFPVGHAGLCLRLPIGEPLRGVFCYQTEAA